ncbi:MAG: CoA pyrophosphatase [Dehalococcoidales bacterium]
MKRRLQELLSRRPARRISDSRRVPAAVLLPLYLEDGRHHLLFIQRTDRVRDHKGQISFPGGAWEDDDGTMQATALREASEEIGLAAGDVEVLGALDEILTIGSNYLISPFVGVFPWPYDLRVDRWETEEAFGVPLAALLDPACLREGRDVLDGQPIPSYFYHYEDRVIWGATARILHQFLGIVATFPAVRPGDEPADEPPAAETVEP